MKKIILILSVLLAAISIPACAQQGPKAVDLGLSVKWAVEDIGPEVPVPEGWRMPTLAEIKELRETCTQSFTEKDGEEWIVFTAKNGNSVSFLYPVGSRSARTFGIAGSDGCYLKVIILNPLLKAPGRDGYYTWEELGETDPGQRKNPVRLVQ
ncbi:MAG: hypothetical protein IJU74_02175 [Bacteroidales bacterium]|nr:hypothetical protein [Bacteroidales bacterium]